MKKCIRASSLTEEFLKYHEDMGNYHKHRAEFDKMYKILDKYGNENEDVDVVFNRATAEDQKKMVDLIRPEPSYKDHSHMLYSEAVSGDTKGTVYGQGVIDMFNQLMEDGYISKLEWSW